MKEEVHMWWCVGCVWDGGGLVSERCVACMRGPGDPVSGFRVCWVEVRL